MGVKINLDLFDGVRIDLRSDLAQGVFRLQRGQNLKGVTHYGKNPLVQ